MDTAQVVIEDVYGICDDCAWPNKTGIAMDRQQAAYAATVFPNNSTLCVNCGNAILSKNAEFDKEPA